jgi:hypothetical protein
MNGDDMPCSVIRVKAVASLAVLVPRYLARRGEDVLEMRRALCVGDLEPVRYIGHRMAGSGGGYGFDALSDLGRRIEEAANAGDADQCSRYATDLDTFLHRVEVFYED